MESGVNASLAKAAAMRLSWWENLQIDSKKNAEVRESSCFADDVCCCCAKGSFFLGKETNNLSKYFHLHKGPHLLWK